MTAAITTIGGGIHHPEGVCWDPSGAIVVGSEDGNVHWIDPESGDITTTVAAGGFIGGIALDARGRAYACDVGGGRVIRVDRSDGSVETFSEGPADAPYRVPNYPVFDAAGRLYVSDSGDWGQQNGVVTVIEPDGEARIVSTEAAGFTNGMALSPDGGHLYVVESTPPLISRLPIGEDGALGPREVVVEMPRTVPDGVAFADDGTLVIACFRPDMVQAWDGRELRVVAEDWSAMSLAAPTNVAFGGAELDRLYSANLHGYHVSLIEAGLTGVALHYPDIA